MRKSKRDASCPAPPILPPFINLFRWWKNYIGQELQLARLSGRPTWLVFPGALFRWIIYTLGLVSVGGCMIIFLISLPKAASDISQETAQAISIAQTQTAMPTDTSTATHTATSTATATATATITLTPTFTLTPSRTPLAATHTALAGFATQTEAARPTNTPTLTPSNTSTPTASDTPRPTNTPSPSRRTETWYISSTNNVNIRSCASTDCTVLTSKLPGDSITVTNTENDWHQVRLDDGQTGYIAEWLTSRTQPVSQPTAPIQQAPVQQINPEPSQPAAPSWNCGGDIYDCNSFGSCNDMWGYWNACPGDPSNLDGNGDGVPCESRC